MARITTPIPPKPNISWPNAPALPKMPGIPNNPVRK